MGLIPRTGGSSGVNGLCTTPACINAADNILGGMALNHQDIDPCTNFSDLVCGNFAAQNPIGPGESSVNALGAVQASTYATVRSILEKPYPSESWITVNFTKEETAVDKENFAKLQGAYDVCMNFTAHEEQGLTQLRNVAKTVVEKFPATPMYGRGVNLTYDHAASMGETLTFFEGLGIETTQRLVQRQQPTDPSKMVIMLMNPTKNGNPTDEKVLPEWLLHASDLLRAVHPANLTKSKSFSLMESVVSFQAQLSVKESEKPDTTATNASDVYLSLPDLQKLAPQLNLKHVIDELAPKGIESPMVAVESLNSLAFWSRISKTISKTSPEVLQAFFIWRSITTLSTYVDSPQTDAWYRFLLKKAGEDHASPEPRWSQCVKFLDIGVMWTADAESIGLTGLSWILGRFFADKNVTPEMKTFTSEIIASLEEAFISRVQTRQWATDAVKQAAIEKVRAMGIKIGLPTSPLATDPTALKEFYSDVAITKSHALNALSLARSRIHKNWASLDKPFDKGQIFLPNLAANAYHSPQENAMVIQSGIMQAPLFSPEHPAYLAFGGMGSIVGHEITHGFDGSGHTFDKTGNHTSWFDEQSSEGFAKATQCFIKQYSNFTVTDPDGEEKKVDGELTMNENVADAGGILAAYAAWKQYEAQHGRGLDLPGLTSYTHEQLFFIKYGQNWCQNLGANGQNDVEDSHAPNGARIALTTENSIDFQKAFNCPRQKPTCELW